MEVVIAIVCVIFVVIVVGLFLLYRRNTYRIQLKKEGKVEEPKQEKIAENTTKPVTSDKTEKKQVSTKEILKEVNKQSEQYIKNLPNTTTSKSNASTNVVTFAETSEEDLMSDDVIELGSTFPKKDNVENNKISQQNSYNDNAIILGHKMQKVHYIEEDDDDRLIKESSSSILKEMDEQITTTNKINKKETLVSLDDFEEDESVGEEFTALSSRMKTVIMSNMLDKKDE